MYGRTFGAIFVLTLALVTQSQSRIPDCSHFPDDNVLSSEWACVCTFDGRSDLLGCSWQKRSQLFPEIENRIDDMRDDVRMRGASMRSMPVDTKLDELRAKWEARKEKLRSLIEELVARNQIRVLPNSWI